MYSLIDGTQIVVTHTESSKIEQPIAPTFKVMNFINILIMTILLAIYMFFLKLQPF